MNDDNALRVKLTLEHGRVVKFVVQLECRFGGRDDLVPVVRYDTAHGFAHCDRLHPYEESQKATLLTRDYGEAPTFAIDDLTSNWAAYRRRYEKWVRQE